LFLGTGIIFSYKKDPFMLPCSQSTDAFATVNTTKYGDCYPVKNFKKEEICIKRNNEGSSFVKKEKELNRPTN
jgi:hypothetical protein